MLNPDDLQALWLTVRLAATVTAILLLIGTPIAWWLARSKAWWKGPVAAVVALPLVLPPSLREGNPLGLWRRVDGTLTQG